MLMFPLAHQIILVVDQHELTNRLFKVHLEKQVGNAFADSARRTLGDRVRKRKRHDDQTKHLALGRNFFDSNAAAV
jgi:hypothetical protein